MSLLVISPEAEEDLLEIWLYIAQDSPDNADAFIDRIERCGQELAVNPGMGVERSGLADSLKSFPVGNYILFYRIAAYGVELVRVLHGARDLGAAIESK